MNGSVPLKRTEFGIENGNGRKVELESNVGPANMKMTATCEIGLILFTFHFEPEILFPVHIFVRTLL